MTSQDLNQDIAQDFSHNTFLIIPAYVADNPKIDDPTALLFGRLNALSNRLGYCFASDAYLAQLTRVSVREIKNRLKALEEEGLIQRLTKKDGMRWNRKIYTVNNYSQIIFTKGSYVPLEGNRCSPSIYKDSNNIRKRKRKRERECERERGLSSPPRAFPSSKKILREKEIATTAEEHEKLVNEYTQEKVSKFYKMLSEWKQDVPKKRWRKSDYLSIKRWVICAYKETQEKEKKEQGLSPSTANKEKAKQIIEKIGLPTFRLKKITPELCPEFVEFKHQDAPSRPIMIRYDNKYFDQSMKDALIKMKVI